MTTEDTLAAARRQMAEAEASVLQALASARAVLTMAEEENRDLRHVAFEHRQQMDFYTEREFAQLLKVSESTIRRLRRAGKLEYRLVGTQIRYTAAQLAQAGETVGVKEQRSRPRRVA